MTSTFRYTAPLSCTFVSIFINWFIPHAEEESTVKLDMYCFTSSVKPQCLCVMAAIFQNEDSWSEPHCWRTLHVCMCVCVNSTSQQKSRGLGAGVRQSLPPLTLPAYERWIFSKSPEVRAAVPKPPFLSWGCVHITRPQSISVSLFDYKIVTYITAVLWVLDIC